MSLDAMARPVNAGDGGYYGNRWRRSHGMTLSLLVEASRGAGGAQGYCYRAMYNPTISLDVSCNGVCP